MLKNFIYFILYFSLIGMGGESWAQENTDCSATFSLETGELSLPCVTILGNGQEKQTYQVNMQQVAPKEDFHFVVTQTQAISHSEVPQEEISFSIIDEGNDAWEWEENLPMLDLNQMNESFLVIRDEIHFTALWKKFFAKTEYYHPLEKPVIDFNQEMVIAVFLGAFANDGVLVKVRKIVKIENDPSVEEGHTTLVSVAVIKPSPDSRIGLTDGYISPYQLIKLKKLPRPVIFNTFVEYSSSWPPE